MLDKEKIYYKIKHLIPFIFGKYKSSGYQRLEEDDRDFKIGSIFSKILGTEYTPLHDSVDIKTLDIKDQKLFNTCVFNSATAGKEVDENTILSVRSLTSQANRYGYISGNGFSDLRSAQKVLQDWGIEESKDCLEGNYATVNDFTGYVGTTLDQAKASLHKSKTFWSVSTKEEILKLLDSNRPIHCAIPWYSGYNQSGGFKSPWIITKTLGYFVGGHALLCRGYIKIYQGKFVVKIQNSYGENWGDNGCFYIDIDFFVKQINTSGYGAYTNLDIESEIGSFLNKYDGKNVKGKNSSAIYRIQAGVKKVYLHEMDYFVYNIDDGLMKNFEIVDDTILNKIPAGDNMDITKSMYWPVLKHLENPLNLTRVVEALKQYK